MSPRRAAQQWAVVLPDGTTEPVDAPLLLGRDPSADRGPVGARLVTIHDPDGMVSRSHVVIEASAGRLMVHDVSSTNGLVLLYPDGTEVDVLDGAVAEIVSPCEIELGALAISVRRV